MSQNELKFISFNEILLYSIQKANSGFFVLLKVLLSLLVYLIRDSIIPLLLLISSVYISSDIRIYAVSISVIGFVYIFIKYNGALGMAYALLSFGREDFWNIASESARRGFGFFVNAFRTGMVLFMGQMLMVCPCFLLMSNHIFSPYLVVYENITGKKAKERSVELASGFSWIVLNRSLALIFMAYLYVFAALVLALTVNFTAFLIILLILGLYLSSIQSHFIFKTYEQTKSMHQAGFEYQSGNKYKAVTFAGITGLILVYFGIKLIRF